MDLGLDSKLILITGATSGIGKAVAELICEESGSVILLARNKEKLKITQDSIFEKNKYMHTNVYYFTSNKPNKAKGYITNKKELYS